MKTHLGRMVMTVGLMIGLAGMLALPGAARSESGALPSAEQYYTKQADGQFVPITLNTNSGTPFLSGPLTELLGTLSAATNWGVATFGIYVPETKSAGCGLVALYNINRYMATGVGIDWIDGQVTMPSGQFQFQAPLTIGGTNGLTVTPFLFTGIATPISGDGDNGVVVGLIGAGLDVKLYKGLGAFYAIEERSGQPGPWQLFGLRWSKSF